MLNNCSSVPPFDAVDENKNERLSFDEVQKSAKARWPQELSMIADHYFKFFDSDLSGYLDSGEYHNMTATFQVALQVSKESTSQQSYENLKVIASVLL